MILQVNLPELLSGSDGQLPYCIKNGTNRFVTEIFTSTKSMIPMTLKHQNWVEPLSGSKLSKFLNNLRLLIYTRNLFK